MKAEPGKWMLRKEAGSSAESENILNLGRSYHWAKKKETWNSDKKAGPKVVYKFEVTCDVVIFLRDKYVKPVMGF